MYKVFNRNKKYMNTQNISKKLENYPDHIWHIYSYIGMQEYDKM